MKSNTYDIVIIGAGIIGLSTGMTLKKRFPRINIAIVEKDGSFATQQSGHNSGVIHSGIYYKPGSFKARFCVEGRSAMTTFCENNGIPVWFCGKLIVSTNQKDDNKLKTLLKRGKANGVKGLELVNRDRINEIEPSVDADYALWAPHTGIVDFTKVCERYARLFEESGGRIFFNNKLRGISRETNGLTLITENEEFLTKNLINCGGLHSDLIAESMGQNPGVRIIPFRGEYYTIRKEREHLVKGLIYPVPDPDLPFLGVHLTQTMKGWVEAGPNAVLAMKREGYRKRDFSFGDVFRTLSFPGFWRMGVREWKTGLWEINRSLRKSVFLKSLQRLVPELQMSDLTKGGSGVRAQAVDGRGNLVDDFRIQQSERSIHVLNAPSPGATSSLVIGEHITNIAAKHFQLK